MQLNHRHFYTKIKKALFMLAVEQMSHSNITILTTSCDSLPGILCIPAVFSVIVHLQLHPFSPPSVL